METRDYQLGKGEEERVVDGGGGPTNGLGRSRDMLILVKHEPPNLWLAKEKDQNSKLHHRNTHNLHKIKCKIIITMVVTNG